MRQYILLHIDDFINPRVGLIPADLITPEVQGELDLIKSYEVNGKVPRYVDDVSNAAIPDEVHQLIDKWYTILDCKPRIDVRLNDNELQEYQDELNNNLPEWHRQSLFNMNGNIAEMKALWGNKENIKCKIVIT